MIRTVAPCAKVTGTVARRRLEHAAEHHLGQALTREGALREEEVWERTGRHAAMLAKSPELTVVLTVHDVEALEESGFLLTIAA